MITPYLKQPRGNSITVNRLKSHLSARGYMVDILSLDDNNPGNALKRALNTGKYEIIHGFHARHMALLLQDIPQISRFPVVLTMTGTDINYDLKGANRDLLARMIMLSTYVVIFNDLFSQPLLDLFPDIASKLITIPQGVHLPPAPLVKRSDLNINADDFVFLLPSGLRPVKNLELAIRAIEKLHSAHATVRLLIMGAAIEESYGYRIRRRIAGLDFIKYLGEIPHHRLYGYLALGNAVINCSLAEGQPQGALEAMSLMMPAILTDVPGNRGVMEHGVHGFYVTDEDSLVRFAGQLVRDRQLATQMGRAAGELIKSRFDLKRELDSYCRLYESITDDEIKY